MAGNFDKFRVKKPNLNKSSEAVAAIADAAVLEEIEDAAVESLKAEESTTDVAAQPQAMLGNNQISVEKVKKTVGRNAPDDSQKTLNSKKSMLQTGYRIREEYIEALRLRAKREERKIESVLDEILSAYFESNESGQKYAETARQILRIKLDY